MSIGRLSASRFSLGLSYNFSHYASGTSFWEKRFGYGYTLGGRDFRAGLSTSNFSGGGFEQRTGSINFSGDAAGGWSVSYENDGYPFGKFGNGAHPETDEYRSAAVAVRVGDFSAGFSVFTGHRDMSASMIGDDFPGYPHGIVENKGINDYKLGAVYMGIGNYRIGKNHYEIGHGIQNWFAHHKAKPQRFIPWRPDAPLNRATYFPNKPFGGYFSPNPYTNW